MAGSRTQYTATFAIGARLMSSFKGVMVLAQKRMAALNSAAMRAGRGVLKLGSLMTAGFAGLAAFGAGKIFHSIFEGANEAVEALNTRTRRLTEALKANFEIRKLDTSIVGDQVKRIYRANAALAKQGVISKGALDNAASMLALQKLTPKRIVQTLGPLSDMLVATQGISEAQQMLPEAAFAFGKAVQTGMAKPLQQFGITLTKPEQALLRQKAKVGDLEGTYKFLMDRVKVFAGSSARALKTPEGSIQALQNAVGGMRTKIGEASEESRGKMADAWRSLLPIIEPYLIKAQQLTNTALGSIADYARTTLIPAFQRFAAFLQSGPVTKAANDLWTTFKDSLGKIGKAFSDMFQSFNGGKKFDFAEILIGTLGKLRDAMKWVGDNASWLVPLVTTLTTAFYAASVAIGLVNAVMAISPIGWVIIGVTGLVAGIILLHQHFGTLTNALSALWEWLQKIPGLGPLLTAFWDGLKKKWQEIIDDWNYAKVAVPLVFQAIGDSITNHILGPINAMKEAWSNSIDFIKNHIPTWAGGTPTPAPPAAAAAASLPAPAPVAKFASGGILTRPTFAQVGERGPEAIIPLSGGPRAEGLLNYASRAIGTGGITNRGDVHVSFSPNVTISGGKDGDQERRIEAKLSSMVRDFMVVLKAATAQERRLSFEGMYS